MPESRLFLQMKKSAIDNDPTLVLETPAGRCFLRNDSCDVMAQHVGAMPVPQEVLMQWRSALERRSEAARRAGRKYAFLIAPDKQTVYWRDIGGGLQDHRNVNAIFADAPPGLIVVDPAAVLIEASQVEEVYPATDSHWDARGAYLAYRELITACGVSSADVLQAGRYFDLVGEVIPGDLGRKLIPARRSRAMRLRRSRMQARMIFDNGVPDNGRMRVWHRNGARGSCLFFGDSFSYPVVDFLAEHFEWTLHLHGTHYDSDLVERFAPALVVSEVTERFMIKPPILVDEDPSELIYLRKIVKKQVTASAVRTLRCGLLDAPPLPPVLADLIRRDADLLSILEASPAASAKPAQAVETLAPADIFVGLVQQRYRGVSAFPELQAYEQRLSGEARRWIGKFSAAQAAPASAERVAGPTWVRVVVVNYESGPWLRKSLAALAVQSVADFEAVVIDNGSKDGSMRGLPIDGRIRTSEAGRNLGFAAGSNKGAQGAVTPWLAFLNPDAIARPDWLEQLQRETREHPEFVMFGSTQLAGDRPGHMDGTGDCLSAWGASWRSSYGKPQPGQLPEGEVFSACGAALLIRRDWFEKLGGFDERFFCYVEDLDLGFRARLLGARCWQSRHALVEHVCGVSTGGGASEFSIYHGIRNQIWTLLRNMPAPLLLPALAGLPLIKLVSLLRKGGGHWRRTLPRALRDAVRGARPFLRERRAIHQQRKASLREVAGWLSWNPLDALRRRPVMLDRKPPA